MGREALECVLFSFTDPKVCSTRSCECPFLGPGIQGSEHVLDKLDSRKT